MAELQRSIRKQRPKTSLPAPRVARLFQFTSGQNGWELGKFRRHYTSGAKKGQYEVKFDDGERYDIPLELADYGPNAEWLLFQKTET